MRAASEISSPARPSGVAAAVVALVVLADHLEGFAERGGASDDVGADDRVLLDPGPLLVGEGLGLVEDVVGDADLAHVVEVGALSQGAQGRRPQAQPQADADRQLGHARRVPVGVGVARLDRADEGPQGLGVAAADVRHRVAGEHPVEHVVEPAAAPIAGQDRIDGRGEAGQQEDVIVPPGQMPGPADLQRQQRPGAQQARHHQRQLHAVEPEPPAPPVHRADGDQHQGRAQHQPKADAGRPRWPGAAPARRQRPGTTRTSRSPARAGARPTG